MVSVNHTLFGNLAGVHTTLNDYINVFEADLITDYFKFTIVRNPWDRLVSAYFFLKKGGFDKADKIGVSERLPRKNAWEHKSYQDYYNEKTKEIVAKVYEEDVRI